MKLLRFEFKKLLRQKKYLWLIIVVTLSIGALFSLNTYQRSRLQNRWIIYQAIDEFRPLSNEWNKREVQLIRLKDEGNFTHEHEKQLEYSRDLGWSLNFLRAYTAFDRWENITMAKDRVLIAIENFATAGGEFSVLEGVDREAAMAKNAWMLEHHIQYEYERSPVTQHLFLKQISSILLGVFGLGLLLILLGNTITEEKEQKTWLTLKSQPISQGKLILSKYIVLMIFAVLFSILVIGIGFLIPEIIDGRTLNSKYPIVLNTEHGFAIMSIKEYLLRTAILFLCSISILMSFSLMISKFVNKSINLFLIVGITTTIGYIVTSPLKSLMNPFFLFNYNSIEVINNWYFLSILFWTVTLLCLAIIFPEKKIKIFTIIKDTKPLSWGDVDLGKNTFKKLCVFEGRKIIREGSFLILSLCMVSVIFLGHLYLAHETSQHRENYLNELQYRLDESSRKIILNREAIDEIKEELSHLNEQYNLLLFGNDNQESEIQTLLSQIHRTAFQLIDFENQMERERTNNNMINGAIEGYKGGNWVRFHRYQYYVNHQAFVDTYGFDSEGSSIGSKSGVETIGRFGKLVSMEEKKWLIDNNIRPVLSGEFLPTINQSWGNNTRIGWGGNNVDIVQWNRENRRIDDRGLFYLFKIFAKYLYFVPLALILFFIGGVMAKEKGKKNTLNFLTTQPISVENIYYGKVVSTSLIALVSTLLLMLFVVLVGSILSRFGNWNFPILHYNSFKELISADYKGMVIEGRGFHFMGIGRYLIHSTTLLMAITVFVIGVSTFISLFMKSSLGVFAMTILFLVVGYYRNWRIPLQISHRSPFTYFNIPRIVNGEMGSRLNEPRINFITGVMVLVGLTVVLMVVSLILINRERIYHIVKGKLKNFL